MHTTTATNKNVVARNVFNQGMTVNIEPTRSYIDFYVDNSMNLATENFNGRLVYEQGGNFTIDVSNIVKFKPRVVFSQDLNKNLVADERLIIYGNPLADVPYIPTIYGDNTFKTGTAAYLVAGDNSSNAFFRLGTEKGTGMTLGGGYFPNDKIMGVVALIDSSNVKYPAMNVISGNLISNLKTSIAVNKYKIKRLLQLIEESRKRCIKIAGDLFDGCQCELLKLVTGYCSNLFGTFHCNEPGLRTTSSKVTRGDAQRSPHLQYGLWLEIPHQPVQQLSVFGRLE
jgi:hypothetical protein